MMNRIKTPALVAIGALALSGCDNLLDVNNPNNLVEESVRQEAAASAVVNGALSLVSSSISQSWSPYLVASDDLYFETGSRDAWLSLDNGFIDDAFNEFIDGPFPAMGSARWMSDEAIEILTEHVGNNPSSGNQLDLARANLFSGMIYMIIGETQEDHAFSDKTEDGAPVGPSNMFTVLDAAITRLDAAVSGGQAAGDDDLVMKAKALRARAKHSRAVWDALNPSASGNGLVNAASAAQDALDVITMAGGVSADWLYNLTYSSGTVGNSMGGQINDRKEIIVDQSLVSYNADLDIDGIVLMDPIDNVADPALIKFLTQLKGGDPTATKGGVYPDLTIASTRMMHLILAENALAGGDTGGFTTHINHVRAMDGSTPFSGQIDNTDMLVHSRRVNTVLQGLRLADMYRFGIQADRWQPQAATVTSPGIMLPISAVELRANCHLNGLGCGG